VVTSGLPGKQNEKPIAVKDLTLTLAKPDGELELDITDKAPLGTLTFHLSGDVDIAYIRNPERLKKAQDEQKRIDALATELAAEAKKAAEEKTKFEKESTEAAAAVAKLKGATGTAEAQFKEAEEKAKAADEAKTKALEADKKAQELVKAVDVAKKEWADELKKATDGAKEKKIKVWFSSMSVMVDVVSVPVTLKSPDAVTIKAGEKADVAVEIVREFGFADEVKVEMAGGNAPVKVAAVTAPGNQAQAQVVLTTEKTAKPGTYTVTLRGSLKYSAKALTVDRTLQVTIEAPTPQ
jgi:hypothetical protein